MNQGNQSNSISDYLLDFTEELSKEGYSIIKAGTNTFFKAKGDLAFYAIDSYIKTRFEIRLNDFAYEQDNLSNEEKENFYNLEYAESQDGINWIRDKNVAIDFKDEYEYALGVPRVIKDNNLYKMWFCSRATKDIDTYRIRYAESIDGINWTRKDEEVGIDVSQTGWDSEMICYPFVFDHKGKRYMLYNGNDYGKTGFGLAVLEND